MYYIYIYMYIYIYIYGQICLYIYIHIRVYIYLYIYLCVCVCLHMLRSFFGTASPLRRANLTFFELPTQLAIFGQSSAHSFATGPCVASS